MEQFRFVVIVKRHNLLFTMEDLDVSAIQNVIHKPLNSK
jgi:hypothetical protein